MQKSGACHAYLNQFFYYSVFFLNLQAHLNLFVLFHDLVTHFESKINNS